MNQNIKCIRCKGTGFVEANYTWRFNNAAFPFFFMFYFFPSVFIGSIYYYLIRYFLPFQILWDILYFFGGITMSYYILRIFLGPLFRTKLQTIIFTIILWYFGYLNVKLGKYQIGENIKNIDKHGLYIFIQILCIGAFLPIYLLAEGMDKCKECDGMKEISIEKYNKIKRFFKNDNEYKVEWNFLREIEGFLLLMLINKYSYLI